MAKLMIHKKYKSHAYHDRIKFNWRPWRGWRFRLLSWFFPKALKCLFWFEFHRFHPGRCSWINRSQGFCPPIWYRCYQRARFRLGPCSAKIWKWLPEDWYFWVGLFWTFYRYYLGLVWKDPGIFIKIEYQSIDLLLICLAYHQLSLSTVY